MRIGRTLPPAAAPVYPRDIFSGLMGIFNGRKEIDRFTSEVKSYFGMKHCFLVSSGKAALCVILQALKKLRPDRDEVLIPAFTCYSVPSAVIRAGLKIRLCDVNPETLDFDFHQISHAVFPSSHDVKEGSNHSDTGSGSLLCVVPTHLFGIPANVERLRTLITDPEVFIVEDAAQAMGGEWEDKKLGTLGDVSFFSLGRGKAFSTLEGGIILTNREDIADRLKDRINALPELGTAQRITIFLKVILLSAFSRPSLFWIPSCIPFLRVGQTFYDPHFEMKKMSAFQAGLARDWQKKLRTFLKARSENAAHWVPLTSENGFRGCLSPADGHHIPHLLRFPVRIDDDQLRSEILKISHRSGLGIMPTYPDSIDGIRDVKPHVRNQSFPVAKELAKNLVTIPIHPLMTENDKLQIRLLLSENKHSVSGTIM